MTTVISVENLGKKYTLHHQQRESYTALRDVLANGAASIGQRLLHPFRKASTAQQIQEEFWALKDVSFEVKQGDRIGIIGRNGAGKSTLLKILSRITEPTTGRVKIKGRVASLLEVGTGFHPELTGRENIYLNGAILGMSRVEIKKKFDEIVDFAEIEKFLDTPVKRYSSGMYVRLAFAVAAHLEPEILVVDEVLAVGDAAFQKKCLGKMAETSHQKGRTVLFVSHNMGAVSELCSTTLALNEGKIFFYGNVKKGISEYLNNLSDLLLTSRNLSEFKGRIGTGEAKILNAQICWQERTDRGCPALGDTISISFEVEKMVDIASSELRSSVAIRTISGIRVLHVTNEDDGFVFLNKTRSVVTVTFPELLLYPGIYTISLWVGNSSYIDYDYVTECIGFEMIQGNLLPRNFKMDWSQGVVFHKSRWEAQ
jgi:lipopolysaccharide transport system ATP-binding protein